ncbi:citrate synthase [Candidatus Uabimicrobium sp. HlEnr_7]|uniref:citrate synthase n=1 Tax=Candidatus Uabimicrobium helgolandensis TaxID=3095367 RepID=UPI0035560DFC
MSDNAELKVGDKVYELPVIKGSEGEVAVDIRKLRATSNIIALDEGFANTGGCQSSVTFINGEEGILRYRGYSIEQLCQKSSFLEVSYLLIYGELPSKQQHEKFVSDIMRHSMVDEDIRKFYEAFPRTAHPMALLSSVICSLSTYYQDELDINDEDAVYMTIVRLIAKITTLAAYAYKKSIGQPLVYPNNNLDYASNFMHMLFSVPCESYQVQPAIAKALDQLFILHADHEQNCSATTVRVVGSSEANLFACIAAGICALWGPLHGGANQKVIEMLMNIQRNGGDSQKYLAKAKDKNDPFRLMGFGHRVYKNFDPRAKIIKTSCDEILNNIGVNDPLLRIAKELEESALNDEYFASRKLYPNVDFYSGIIYRAIGFPTNMFTVLFAIGRLPGWIAQWREMLKNPGRKIARPRQIYTGQNLRDLDSTT